MSETPATHTRSLPFREDCWSEDATQTLVEAWGERYLELNRGNLRQKHWQEVADAVNARHASGKKPRRTDVQCKNRIDTLKKKYKLEKARITSSNGAVASKWPFYRRLNFLIGSSAAAAAGTAKNRTSPPVAVPIPYHKNPPQALPQAVVVRSGREKRPSPSLALDDSYFRKSLGNLNHGTFNFNGSTGQGLDSESSRSSSDGGRREAKDEDGDGFRQLAQAIARFGEIYERVEEAKQAQMIELEKQRMEFTKLLEFERMQLFMDSQVQIEKIKRARRAAASSDNYS